MLSCTPVLLIVDYNLSRISDVSHMRDYARKQWGAQTWLVRANSQSLDSEISDRVIDANPLDTGFINDVLSKLGEDCAKITAGIVFSDNAVVSGSMLLERLGLPVDDAKLALGAFDKLAYRIAEERLRSQMNLMGIMLPDFVRINCLSDLRNFAAHQNKGVVIKPACEGNNRGVMKVEPGGDCEQAFSQVTPYLEKGVLAETFITFTREYSYDGLGSLWFITEKVSAKGSYPVEVAQILPARLREHELLAIRVAGEQVNRLVGQHLGPFHNEIKLSDNGYHTAVVESNRRPGGMKIWTLAHAVYGVDLYAAWIDSAFVGDVRAVLAPSACSAATVMLGVPCDMTVDVSELGDPQAIVFETLMLAAQAMVLNIKDISLMESAWVSSDSRLVHAIPQDNNGFLAYACVALHDVTADIRDLVEVLRKQWLEVLGRTLASAPKYEALS